jgi:hypothetical protein
MGFDLLFTARLGLRETHLRSQKQQDARQDNHFYASHDYDCTVESAGEGARATRCTLSHSDAN